jgi:hypothetical protein
LTLHMASLGRMETGGRRARVNPVTAVTVAVTVPVTRMLAPSQAATGTGILLPRHRSAAVMTRPRVACATSGPGDFFEFNIRATQVKKVLVSDFRSKAYQ